ncbi:glycoside hydrolase family 105 protein [Flavobacterium sinopsychrotolerans]|uniref:Unsaturated rhamnogalacturonyl hydrolase n=1 Tax=Flavobacterium sinopsychrotolerans TaxID=604089 RepID=A0A1H8I768_9FLAO|nr:glycoside hydrolase family 88 protein [Flavobacterium sinopsychrotolerans]SEN63985.1 unsaturated rhamnogalacturonyl hydrolase [Flavobacterium sinopsychrotolerans]
MKNNILKLLIAVLLIAFVSLQINAQKDQTISKKLKWSERMALSIMMQHKESYMIDDATTPKWDYVHGLVLISFDELNKKYPNQKYSVYSKTYVDKLVQEDGTIDTYKLDSYNIDMVVAGRLLFDLYTTTKEAKYLKALQTLRKQIEEQPRTASGGFWHKKIYPNQMWLDGLYMGEPFYAQYTVTFEDGKNLDDVAKQFQLIQKNARDSKTGLFYHGWDESKQMPWANKTTGTSPNFWSRSLGWYAMALVDVLDYFPKDHPKQKELVSYLNQLANTLVKFQDKSGLWYQVTDKGSVGGNYLEASGTAMFTYAFAKGVNKGYLPKKFKTAAKKAFSGMTKHLIKVGQNGEVTITQACAVAGLGGNPYRDGSFEYYVNERKKDNDPKATGPFILAALELNK